MRYTLTMVICSSRLFLSNFSTRFRKLRADRSFAAGSIAVSPVCAVRYAESASSCQQQCMTKSSAATQNSCSSTETYQKLSNAMLRKYTFTLHI